MVDALGTAGAAVRTAACDVPATMETVEVVAEATSDPVGDTYRQVFAVFEP